ncbi:MAG: hypothetical protein LUC43_05025 [Burkholderiales bacterium]|nr:hypothetical protein [Burkholderiales bacterium]
MQKTSRTLVLAALGSAIVLALGCTHEPRHEAYAPVEAQCTQQNAGHCLTVGEKLFNDGMMAQTAAQSQQCYNEAIQTFENGCQWGNAPSCFLAGRAYEIGFYKTKSTKTAEEYFQQACNGGVIAACGALGDIYTHTRQYKQANAVYQQMCDKYQDQKACEVVAAHKKGKRTTCYYN